MKLRTLLLALGRQKSIRDWKSVLPVRSRGKGHTFLAVLGADDQSPSSSKDRHLLVLPLSVSSQVDRLASRAHLSLACKFSEFV
jgi:hypothetical protein